jgi:hypothetical protein
LKGAHAQVVQFGGKLRGGDPEIVAGLDMTKAVFSGRAGMRSTALTRPPSMPEMRTRSIGISSLSAPWVAMSR